MKEIVETVSLNSFVEVVQDGNYAYVKSNKILGPLPTKGYDTTVLFDEDKDIYSNVIGQSITLTLSSLNAVNGVGVIVRLNRPASVSIQGVTNEAHPNAVAVDPTKLNCFTFIYYTNWGGTNTPRVIYLNTLFNAL